MSDLPVSKKMTFSQPKEMFDLDSALYTYKAYVSDIYDGDTITADIDLGLKSWQKGEKLRLARVNAPEMRPKKKITVDGKQLVRAKHQRDAIKVAAKKSRDWLREKILHADVLIKTDIDKTGKYGRYIAEIYVDGENINDQLVKNGHAVYHKY